MLSRYGGGLYVVVMAPTKGLMKLTCADGRIHGATPHRGLSFDGRYLERRAAVEAVPAQHDEQHYEVQSKFGDARTWHDLPRRDGAVSLLIFGNRLRVPPSIARERAGFEAHFGYVQLIVNEDEKVC